jgi:hypothetical protein
MTASPYCIAGLFNFIVKYFINDNNYRVRPSVCGQAWRMREERFRQRVYERFMTRFRPAERAASGSRFRLCGS